jgi:hypothetical protein
MVTMPGAVVSAGLGFLGHGHSAKPPRLRIEFILSVYRKIK